MKMESLEAKNESGGLAKPKPEAFNELTPRAVICGLFIAAVMGAAYPYVVLKIGFGPNVSVVAAILGYVILGLLVTGIGRAIGLPLRAFNRWENNIVQTAGTAGAQTAFMCVLLAAFDMLAKSGSVSFNVTVTPVQSLLWLSTAGILGVLLAVPLRRHFIVEEKLPFVDGIAAGETVVVCDSQGPAAMHAARAMSAGILLSAIVMSMTEESHLFALFSATLLLGPATITTVGFGIEQSLLALGSGMLLGIRINASMLLGTVISWVIAPYALRAVGFIPEAFTKRDVLAWVMWPATAILVAGGITALFMRWKVLARTFRNLSSSRSDSDEFPIRWAAAGAVVAAVALIAVQKSMFQQPIWITATAIVLSLPLALVGLRVLGETN